MKVIDLGNKIIFANDIRYIYNKERTGEYRNYTDYYIVTEVGTFEVDNYEYEKVKEYLLSLNDEITFNEDEYIELSNKYERLNNRNEELQEENEKLKKELEIEINNSNIKSAQIKDKNIQNDKLKTIINKSLEYIEEHKRNVYDTFGEGIVFGEMGGIKELLKILKGE